MTKWQWSVICALIRVVLKLRESAAYSPVLYDDDELLKEALRREDD